MTTERTPTPAPEGAERLGADVMLLRMAYAELPDSRIASERVALLDRVLAALRGTEGAVPVAQRIEGWASMGRVSWEFAPDDGRFTPGPESLPAALLIYGPTSEGADGGTG